MEQLLLLDGNILLMIQNHVRMPFLNPIMLAITHLGDVGLIWILLAVFLLARKQTRRAGVCLTIGMIIMVVLNDAVLKNLFARTRPYEVVEGLQRLIGIQKDYSFPSGHSAVCFAAVAALRGQIPKKYWVVCVVLAVLIAFSRLYVGVHYPTDVLGGALIGYACGLVGVLLGKKIVKQSAIDTEK